MKKYTVNENYFENIDTEEKAYWLGFLYADGNVYYRSKNSGCLRLKLGEKDKKHIELFAKCLESNHQIKDIIAKIKYKGNLSISNENMISIWNPKLINDLVNNGCVVNKTFKLVYPSFLSSNLDNHFIRGYFDGDGSVSNNINPSSKILGTYNFLLKTQFILLSNNIKSMIYKAGNIYSLQISVKSNNLLDFKNFLYKDHSICLERKRSVFYAIDVKDIKESLRQKAIKRTKYKISQYNLDMSFIKTWDCIGDIFEEHNYDKKSIYLCCKNTRITAYKYKWQFQKEKL